MGREGNYAIRLHPKCGTFTLSTHVEGNYPKSSSPTPGDNNQADVVVVIHRWEEKETVNGLRLNKIINNTNGKRSMTLTGRRGGNRFLLPHMEVKEIAREKDTSVNHSPFASVNALTNALSPSS